MKRQDDKRFPKAELLSIEWCGMPPKLNYGGKQKRNWRPLYHRMANAAGVYLWPIKICWRMPWLPHAAWQMGWDAHFRQANNLGEYSQSLKEV